MKYYLFLFVYMFLVQYLLRNTYGKEVVKMIISFLPLFLFGALRIDCGDFEIYEQYNSMVRNSSYNIMDVIDRMEPGYAYMNKLFSYRWVIVLSSLLSCLAYCVLFVKLIPQKYRWFGVILFFLVSDKTFYFMFSSIRNSISISILLIYMSYRICNQQNKSSVLKELIVFIIMTSLASLFHASALVFFPLAFIATFEKQINRLELTFWMIALLMLWLIPVDRIIETSGLFQNDYFSRYDNYLEETKNAGLMAKLGATIFAILCFVLIRVQKININPALSRLMLIFVYSYMLGGLNIRVSQYFVSFAIVFLTSVFANRRTARIWSIALLLFAVAFMFYSSFVAGSFASTVYSPFINYRISV